MRQQACARLRRHVRTHASASLRATARACLCLCARARTSDHRYRAHGRLVSPRLLEARRRCVRCSLGSLLSPLCVRSALCSLLSVCAIHGMARSDFKLCATCSTRVEALRADPTDHARARARLCAHACAHAPLRVSLSSSERVQVLAGARPCSQVSRTARRDHRNSKLRGYIWGRFAASFWLGISKTPPLFEILRSALRACSGSMSTSMSMGTSTSTSTSMSTSMNRSMNMRTSMSMSMSTYRKRFLNLKKTIIVSHCVLWELASLA